MHDDTSLTVGRVKRVLEERIRPEIPQTVYPVRL